MYVGNTGDVEHVCFVIDTRKTCEIGVLTLLLTEIEANLAN